MLFKPFDYNPVSVSVKTGAYSIPVGRYALVIPDVTDSDFTIDGNVALETHNFNSSGTNANQAAGPQTVFTNSSKGPMQMRASANAIGTNNATVEIVTAAGTFQVFDEASPALTEFLLGEGESIQVVNNGGIQNINWDIKGYKLQSYGKSEFWVPAETDLNGDRYTVIEYLIPT